MDGVAGEVTAIRDGLLVVQAYEYTGGLSPGQPVVATGRPLSARLTPDLLGQVFDGLLRPLSSAGTWLVPGRGRCRAGRRWPGRRPPITVHSGRGGRARHGRCGRLGAVPGAGSARPARPRCVQCAPAGPVGAADPVAIVGGIPVTVVQDWPVRRPRPFRSRREAAVPLVTGQRVIDMLHPVAQGSAAGVPGGFGTGKTMLLQQIAKWCDADVIIYVGCGERGNELADAVAELSELDDPRTGGRLIDRTVVIANTSNMPLMAREASIYTAATVAEFYRDMGLDVVVIADSTSRWAEALREFASRTGEVPAEEGYPARLASALAAFLRAGRAGRDARRPERVRHDRRRRVAARWRPHRAGHGQHPALRPGTVDTRPRSRVLATLPGRRLGRLVLPGRRGPRSVARPQRRPDLVPAPGADPGPARRAPTGSAGWPSSSASARCRRTSGSSCSPAGCCARACCSRAR